MKNKFSKLDYRLPLITLLGAIFGYLIFYCLINFMFSDTAPTWIRSVILFTLWLPHFVSGLSCLYILNNPTFGCVSLNFYTFPIFYGMIFYLIYYFYKKKFDKL